LGGEFGIYNVADMKSQREQYIMVFMTCDKKREAEAIAKELLKTRNAACVSIYPRGDSMYWWKGVMESSREYLVIAKTLASLLEDLIAVVKRIHSYDVPEIVAQPIVGGNRDYLKWLGEELDADKRGGEEGNH
jgi:periplasmic divalent cation tolerance protein